MINRLRSIIQRFREIVSHTVSTLDDLPWPLKYPIIVLLVSIVPAISVAVLLAGASVGVAISPILIVAVLWWVLSEQRG